MKFSIGDIVVVLHSNENGEIIDTINDEMFLVKVGGISFPVYKDQVELLRNKQMGIESKIENSKTVSTNEEGVWVIISPVFKMNEFGEEVVKKLKISLQNNTKSTYSFSYKLSFLGNRNTEFAEEIQPSQTILLNEILFEEINDYPILQFQFSLVDFNVKKVLSHSVTLKLKPKQVFFKIEELSVYRYFLL